MEPWLWIVLGCLVWMVIGFLVLLSASKKWKHGLFPAIGFVGGIDTDIPSMVISLVLFGLWLLFWPLHLFLAPQYERYFEAMMPSPDKTQLGLRIKLASGERGIAVTALRPTGKIEINGNVVDARSQHGTIDVGMPVEVVGLFMKRPVVKMIHQPEETSTGNQPEV